MSLDGATGSTALYNRWRSRSFANPDDLPLIGQDHITRTLRNAVASGQIAHAYLFCGPRGTGKTSAARILARSVNCRRGLQGEPCNQCENCQALLTGVDEGLGVGLVTLNPGVLKEVFKVPEDWIPMPTILVGYPAEDWNGGGQRPRPPFEELYFEGEFGKPFARDEKVVEELKAANMIQPPAKPNDPERIAEIKRLAEKYGLPM